MRHERNPAVPQRGFMPIARKLREANTIVNGTAANMLEQSYMLLNAMLPFVKGNRQDEIAQLLAWMRKDIDDAA